MTLEGEGKDPFRLSPGDAFVIPPGMATRYADPTADLELLEVTLPGNPPTEVVSQVTLLERLRLLSRGKAKSEAQANERAACGKRRGGASHSDQMVREGAAMTLLVKPRRQVRERAYAPYSRFKVGAALRSHLGRGACRLQCRKRGLPRRHLRRGRGDCRDDRGGDTALPRSA
jgi:hypothetical protein